MKKSMYSKTDMKQDMAMVKGKSSAVKKAFMKEDMKKDKPGMSMKADIKKDKAIMKKVEKKFSKKGK